METDSAGALGSERQPVSRRGAADETSGNRSDLPERDESKPLEPQVPDHHERGLSKPILGGGLVALLVLSAAAFFYSHWASQEVASGPSSEQAASPSAAEPAAPAPRAPENAGNQSPSQQTATSTPPSVPTQAPSAPSVTAAPNSPGTLSPLPGSQAPAAPTQGPTDRAPIESTVRPTPVPPTSMRNQPTSLPSDEVVVVQKPRVNIRSEPRRSGKVVGSATKGSQFKVVRRVGNWVQIEGEGGKGWVGQRLLGPRSP